MGIPIRENFVSVAAKQARRHSSLKYRKLLILCSQVCLIILTYYCAFLLEFDFTLGPASQRMLLMTLPLVLIAKLPIFYRFGLMSGWWRYVGMKDLLDIACASISSSGLLYLLFIPVVRVEGYPVAAVIIDLLLTIVLTGGARFAVRAYSEYVSRSYSAQQKNSLIIGAGSAGSSIVRELQHHSDLDYNPAGFVDDDLTKQGIKIHGVKVLGTIDDLEELIAKHEVECVLIAIPSADGTLVERIVRKCRATKVDFKILPRKSERMNGSSFSRVRNVKVEDLLGRSPVRLELDSIREKLEGKIALITGAGGSIGSELSRQIASFNPRKLILFERSENDTFKLCAELAKAFPNLDYVPVIGDILDVGMLREVLATHRPESVFHAAAYKHVPMMEHNCFQAVTNNIFGTYNVAVVAAQCEVQDFVLISSDKAVNPSNIMGVTKRVAEMIILGLQDRRTRFMAVRFGNVLGSNGSVLPMFEQQIASGGPVTVTHPQARRYFMTIPEAAQLVLQACSMGRGGEIFVLDMGKPVDIVDMAHNLIRLSGKVPGRDIEIVYTGLRPGEKLFEELVFKSEQLQPTRHDKVRVLECGPVNFGQIRLWLDELSASVEARNVNGLIGKLKTMVPEYTPSSEILSLCAIDRHDRAWRYKRERASLTAVAQDAA